MLDCIISVGLVVLPFEYLYVLMLFHHLVDYFYALTYTVISRFLWYSSFESLSVLLGLF